MRVNVTYSVELEEVLQTTAELVHNTKEHSLRPLAKKLDEALILLNKEDEKNAMRRIDEVRQELAKVDLRLLDCMNILSGYQNVTVNNTTADSLELEDTKENEVTDEEG